MQDSKIEWTHNTFNPWRGCTKVSAGCANCYADTFSKRNPKTLGIWGKFGSRVVASEAKWKEPIMWNKAALKAGIRQRVFCASLADVFEGEDTMPPDCVGAISQARERLWQLIESTPNLDWQILTKRPENIATMLPKAWLDNPLPNVWLGTSVENQQAAQRIRALKAIPARIRFLSCEPLLGAVEADLSGIHWVIGGGESGSGARPVRLDWAISLRDQCNQFGIPFFWKQWGTRSANPDAQDPTDAKGGCLLAGFEYKQFPT